MISRISPSFKVNAAAQPKQGPMPRKAALSQGRQTISFAGDEGSSTTSSFFDDDFKWFDDASRLSEAESDLTDFSASLNAREVMHYTNNLAFDQVDLNASHHARKAMQPLLEQLNLMTGKHPFPLGRKIEPEAFSPRKLGEHNADYPSFVTLLKQAPEGLPLGQYIADHPRFETLLQQDPEGLQHGLVVLAALSRELETMPASRALRNRNAYVHQHLLNHSFKYGVQEILKNPLEAEGVADAILTGMTVMNENAKKDPSLKTEEQIVREIELHDQKVDSLQELCDQIAQRDLLEYLHPDHFEPDPDAHPGLQDAQRQLHAIAKNPDPKEKQRALMELEAQEREHSGTLRGERLRQEKLYYPIYTSLSELLREKTCRRFSSPTFSHPLKDKLGFRELWEKMGGGRLAVLSTPFDLESECVPADKVLGCKPLDKRNRSS